MTLRLAGALLALVAACKLGTDLNQIVAIEIVLPDSGRIEVTDTLRPHARALDGRGDSVAVPIVWKSLDTNLVVLDTTTGVTFAKAVGTGRLQARAGTLPSNPQTIFVLPPLDSIGAGGPTRDTVTVSTPDSLSDSLIARVYAPNQGTSPLVGRRVVFAIDSIFPSGGTNVTLVPQDTVTTGATGLAVARVRLTGGPLPDSVVVTATVRRFDGSPVPGSPVTFVVEFRP